MSMSFHWTYSHSYNYNNIKKMNTNVLNFKFGWLFNNWISNVAYLHGVLSGDFVAFGDGLYKGDLAAVFGDFRGFWPETYRQNCPSGLVSASWVLMTCASVSWQTGSRLGQSVHQTRPWPLIAPSHKHYSSQLTGSPGPNVASSFLGDFAIMFTRLPSISLWLFLVMSLFFRSHVPNKKASIFSNSK